MSFTQWLLKGKILEKRPCEKTSFYFGAMLLIALYSVYLVWQGRWMYPEDYLWFPVLGVVSGYAGVLYYRRMHNKHPLFIFNPWKKY